MKKLITQQVSMKILSFLFVVALIALMLPVIYIGKYDKPSADDYGYAATTYHAWNESHSIGKALQAAAGRAENSYQTWQGTFSSIFLMALNPAAFDYRLYKLVPAFIVSIVILSCFMLSKVIIGDLLKKKVFYWIITGSALSILIIEKMHTIPSGIYWYNAAVHYTFMQAALMLLIAAILKMVQTEKNVIKIILLSVSIVLSIAVGGSNYATCLIGLVALLTVIVLQFVYYKRNAVWSILPFMVYGVSFFLNVSAPGNAVRQGHYQGLSAVQSILKSFQSAFAFSVEWMDIFTLIMLLILIPVFWNCLDKIHFQFRLPGIVALYSFCIMAAGFTSSYYSMGNEGLSRTHNVIKMTYQVFLIINEAYFIGWIKSRVKEKAMPLPVWGLATAVFVMGCTVLFASNKAGTFTTYASVYYIQTNEAPMFYNEYMERRAILEHSSETDIVLKPYQFKPWLLYIDDITTDPQDWRNQGVSFWYGKNSVRLVEGD